MAEPPRPEGVAFVGVTGFRAAVDPRAVVGLQPARFGGRPAYVLPVDPWWPLVPSVAEAGRS